MASFSLSTFLFLSLLLLSTSFTAYAAHALPTLPPAEAPHPPHHHHPPPPSTPPPSHLHPPPPSHTPPPSHPHLPPPSPPAPPTHPHPPPPSHPTPPTHPNPPPPSHPTPPSPTHPHPPTHPSLPPPTPPSHPAPTPPAKPPVHPPVKPPAHPPPTPRKNVAVQGVVYCKSCKYRGVDTLVGATPLVGAVVKMECNNTKYSLREKTKTDKNGYFFIMPQNLTTAGSHKCKVSLVSSPLAACNVPTNLHGGAAGAILSRTHKPKPLPFELFTVGPFAFEASKKLPCHY